MDTQHIHFDDFKLKIYPYMSFVEDVMVIDREYRHMVAGYGKNPFKLPFRIMDAVSFVLCCDGEISFNIDYTTFDLSKGSLLVLSNHNIIDHVKFDDSSEAVALVISQKLLMDIVHETPVVRKIMKVNNYRHKQALELGDDEMRDLVDLVMRIKKYLKKNKHAFQSRILRNEISNFIMEITHIYIQKTDSGDISSVKASRRDVIFRTFILLLIEHNKEKHEVTFYANKLGMTPGNLSRTITAASGKSPLQLISEVLLIEAKTLLRKPDTNVKQVSDELNFGDQSSFGKFFKKHTGLTPVEYKNRIKE